jgi:predicted PurR-regulated permease PerM
MAAQIVVEPHEWTYRRVVGTTLALLSVIAAFWLAYRLYQVIFVVFVSLVLGTVIRPFVDWLNRRGVSRRVGVILIYVLMLSLLVGFALLLIPVIVEQSATITVAMPGYYQGLRTWFADNPNPLMLRMGAFLPALSPALEPGPQTGQQVLLYLGKAFGYGASAAGALFMAIAMLLLAYHWTLAGPRAVQSLLQLAAPRTRDSISELITAMETKVGRHLAGQGILCVAVGLLALVAYLLIGLPNAVVLGLIAGVLEAVPMIGPLLGAVPAAVVALAIAPTRLLWVIVATLAIQQLENAVLVPRVMRKAVGVNPFVSLIAIFGFSSLFGIGGALMAIPLAAIVQIVLDRFVFHPVALDGGIPGGRGYASRLRYEANDLAADMRKLARLDKGGSGDAVGEIEQVMDEIESIATDLDALLAHAGETGVP